MILWHHQLKSGTSQAQKKVWLLNTAVRCSSSQLTAAQVGWVTCSRALTNPALLKTCPSPVCQACEKVLRAAGKAEGDLCLHFSHSSWQPDMLSSTSNEGGLARPLTCCRKKLLGQGRKMTLLTTALDYLNKSQFVEVRKEDPDDLPPIFTTSWVFPVAQDSTASLAHSASAFALKGALTSLQQESVSLMLGSCHSLKFLLKLPRNELWHQDTVTVLQGTVLKHLFYKWPSKQVSQKNMFRMLFTSQSTELFTQKDWSHQLRYCTS